jgi:tripartite-type tricarboxylate transporter receptor subunit TctC
MLAPPRTSRELVAKINGAVVEALRHPDVQKKLADLTADSIANSPAEAAAFIAEEKARWGKVYPHGEHKAE